MEQAKGYNELGERWREKYPDVSRCKGGGKFLLTTNQDVVLVFHRVAMLRFSFAIEIRT